MSEFLQRMKDEESDLTRRIVALDNFIATEAYYALEEDARYLLDEQIYPMRQYQNTLRRRIALASGWVKPRNKAENCDNETSPCPPSNY